MAAAFNLTAQLNLRGPNNVRNIVADIRRQLGTITGDVNLRIDPATTQNVTRLNGALTTLNNNLRVTQTNATNAANAMRQFTASISNIGNSTNNLNRNLNNAAVAAQRVGQQAQGTGRQVAVAATAMEEFGRQSQLAVKRFIAFSTGTAGVVGLVTAVRKGIDAFIEFDKQFVKLQQVTGESSVGLSKLANTISSLSTGLGVSSSELTEVSSTLAQAGLSARDTERALKALALSSLAPSFDNMNQTVEGSIALMRQFDISAADLEKSLGAVNAVAAKFAVESSDIIAAIQRTGGVFASASRGVSKGTDALNEFIAVFTSVRATTRESAETIATGLRTIFTRIQRGGTVEALKEFGVNLTDAEGKFVGAYKAVQLLSKGLNNIDPRDLKFSQIVEELGGFRQIGKVIPLIQQFATAQEALKVAQAGQASLAEDAAIAQLSLANQAAKVREEFLALFREIGGSDTFQTMAKGALSLASALISVADSVKGVLPVLAIMTAFRGASALRQFGTGFAGGFRSSGGMQGLGNRLGGGRQTNAKGGFIKRYRSGGDVEQVPVALMPGEAVIFPEDAARIGSSTLKRMNYADKRQKRAKGGKIGMVPGQGNSDSFYTTLPVGSFVIRKAATEAMGPDFIGDVAKGRQKFASGGIAALSTLSPGVGQSKIQSYIDDNTEVKKRKSKLQSKDIVSSNIQRKQLTKKDIGNIDLFRKSINTRTTTIGSRRGGTRFSNQGIAFENWIWDNIPSIQKSYRRARSKTYPLDLIPKSKSIPPAEIKFTTEQVPDPFILNKRLRYNLLNSDFSGFTKNIDKNAKVRPYTTIVYELAPGLKDEIYYGKDGPSKSTLLSRKQRKDQQSTRLEKLGFSQNRYGGYIQKLMAGTFVKSTAGRKKKQILADITKEDAERLPSSTIIGELTAPTIESRLRRAGIALSANDLMRKRNLSVQEAAARDEIIGDYVTKINNKARDNRDQNIADTKAASRAGLLFGAVGMFGAPFPAENIQITKGLKKPTDIRVFGAVLDRNKAAREARLQKREEKLQKINTKRVAKGKSELKDIYSLDIMGAPIASDKSREYTKEEISGIKNRRNQSIIKEAEAALKLGLTGFFDFDDTSVIGRTAFPAGYQEEKPMKGQPAKSPDYTLFGNMNAVGEGLGKAKPTPLMKRLVRMLRKAKKRDTNLYNSLLSRINILSARPDDTMKQVVGPWLKSQGLDLPGANVMGVGSMGMSAKGVAAAKTSSMLQKAGASNSFIVDDSAINTGDARAAGIRAYTYSPKVDLDRATRKSLADMEGAKFENDLKAVLQDRAPLLYQAMSQQSETHRSVDFPYGLGPNIARGWFNNALLASIPVDAKRTLSGPRGVILKNITNYLKTKGYASGGEIPSLDLSRSSKDKRLDPKKLASFLGQKSSTTDQQKKLAELLKDTSVSAPSKVNYEELLKGYARGGEINKLATPGVAKSSNMSISAGFDMNKIKEQLGKYVGKSANGKESYWRFAPGQQGIMDIIENGRIVFTGPESMGVKVLKNRKAGRKSGSPFELQEAPTLGSWDTFARGGEVPIVAQEGEYVINRKSAQSIGYHNLAKLNKYHSGGKVQKLRFGGMSENRTSLTAAEQQSLKDAIRARTGVAGAFPAIPDPYTAAQQARIERQATAKGVAIPSAPVRSYDTGPGISSAPRSLSSNRVQKSTNDAIRAIDEAAKYGVDFAKEIRDTFEQTKKRITAQMARAQNAGKDPVKLAAIEQVADRNARIEATKKGISLGAFPQQIMGRRNLDDYSGMLNYSLRQKPVAPPPPPPPPKTIWTTLNSAVKTISDSLSTVGKKINTFGSNVDASGVSRDATGRRKRGFGKTGGGGFMSSNAAMGLSFAIPMAADLFAGGEAKSESAASSNALTQGIATSAGSSLMLGSMIGDMTQGATGLMKFAGPAAMAATAAIGVAKAFADAENAAREFAITSATDKLESNIEKASKSFDSFQKDLKNIDLKNIVQNNIISATSAADDVQNARGRTQRGLVNFADTGSGSSERSQILFEKGIGDYLASTSLFGGGEQMQSNIFSTMIPKKANQAAKDYAGASQLSSQFLEQRVRSGESVTNMMVSGDFTKLTRSLSLADSAVQEQIMNIKNSTEIDSIEKQKRIDAILAMDGEIKARKLESDVIKQMKLEEFDRSTNQLQNSMERMFQNMEQAIGKNVFELDKLSEQANLSAAALSGQAKAGSVRLKSINVLQNPRAYSSNERNAEIAKAGNMFGAESSTVSGLLQASGRLEDTIMSTINQTIKEDPKAGNEKIGIRITSSISKVLEGLKLPPDVSAKLGESVNAAIGKIRTKGDEKIDFGDLMEKIPQLGKVMDITRRAQEAAVKALEHWQGALNDYGNSMNQIVDLQVEANARLRRASDIGARGQMELDKALGKEISLRTQMSVALAGVKSQTGGATNPVDISQNIRNLENRRSSLESMSNTAAQRGYSGKDEFMIMQDRLRNTNMALRENYDALKSMADNTEMASIAMSKINEIQQKRQAGVNIAERLVTSSPEELSSLNRAMDRLNNNMAGNLNMGSTSDQRKESLDAFNMIAPFLGEQQNAMKANVLESMLLESGVGTNGMMGEVIQSLRNPEGDPQMQAAIEEYKKAVTLQESANRELANLNNLIAQNTAETSATKLAAAMQGVKFDFNSTQLSDIDNSIKNLIKVVEGKPAGMAPVGRAMGGLIYAAAGQLVDFQPKGTDTVPAMLTPGEFVVNRAATQRNLPLLNKINSGGYSKGGKVRYYNDGGFVTTDPKWSSVEDAETRESVGKTKFGLSNNNAYQSSRKYLNTKLDEANIEDTKLASNLMPLYTVAGRFYAVSNTDTLSSAKIDTSSSSKKPSVSFNPPMFSVEPNFGLGYKSLKLDRNTGEVTFNKDMFNLASMPFGIFPKLGFESDKMYEDYISKDKQAETISKYNKLLEIFGNIKKAGAGIIDHNGHRVHTQYPSSVAGLKPEIKINNNEIVIDNLAAEDDKHYQLFNQEQLSQLAISKPDPGRIIGFDSNYAERIENNRDPIFGSKKWENTRIDVVSDKEKFNAWGGYSLVDFKKNYSTYIRGAVRNFQRFNQADMLDMADKSIALIEKIQKDKADLTAEKFTKEADNSVNNKNTISKFNNLWNSTVFKDSFGEDYSGFNLMKAGVTPPLTLYNEGVSNDWSKYVEKINKLAIEKTNLKYSKLNTDFIEMKNLADNSKKKFAWTDGSFTEEDFKNIFGGVAQSADYVRKNVIVKENMYDKNGLKFSYKTYEPDSRLYDLTAKRYTDTLKNMDTSGLIGVIPSQKSSDDSQKGINPFLGFDQNIVFGYSAIGAGIDDVVQKIQQAYKNGLSKVDLSTAPFVDGVEEFTLSGRPNSDGKYRIFPPTQTFDFSAFFAAGAKLKEDNIQKASVNAAKKEMGAAEMIKLTDAKRVTVARKVAEYIKGTGNADLVSPAVAKVINGRKDIESVNDIRDTAIAISSIVPGNVGNDSLAKHRIDAWRALFSEIYKGAGSNSETLQQLGADMADGRFGAVAAEEDYLGKKIAKFYKTYDGLSGPSIQAIIDREIAIKTGQQTSTEYKTQEGVDDTKQTTYAFGAKGLGKVEEIMPDNWNSLREIALDPQRIFPNKDVRQGYLTKLSQFYDLGTGPDGITKMIPDDRIRAAKIQNIATIKTYFKEFDNLVNTGLSTDNLPDPVSAWDVGKLVPYGSFNRSLQAITTDPGPENWDKFRKTADEPLRLENNQRLGTLNANNVATLIRATSQLKQDEDKRKQDQVQAEDGTGFFANGGMVYANKGTLVNYQPRGTDTVPAMLTPGEFVINRESTSKYLPVLRAINSGAYSRGDLVKHFNSGGIVTPRYYTEGVTGSGVSGSLRKDPFDFSKSMGDLANKIISSITNGFEQAAARTTNQPLQQTQTLNGVSSSSDAGSLKTIDEFTNRLRSIADTLAGLGSIPKEINVTSTHTHNVIINGDAALNKLSPDLQQIVWKSISIAFDELEQANKIPGAPIENPFRNGSRPT